MYKTKVFCVGLHKTGTTSLEVALKSVDYRVAGYFGIDNPHIVNDALAQAIEIMKNCDAAQDDPWYLLYKELDCCFPHSKFILTTRNSEKWIKSCIKHFGGSCNEVRKWFYGEGKDEPLGNEDHWIQCKEQHENRVRDFFLNRSNDFLEMDITRGDNWDKLGPFLGINKRGPFPKINTASQRMHHDLWIKYSQSIGVKRLFFRLCMKIVRESDRRAFRF